jgi:hypothetical protein
METMRRQGRSSKPPIARLKDGRDLFGLHSALANL